LGTDSSRWRYDDGNEASATWRAPKDEFIVGGKPLQTVRLRFCVYPILGKGTDYHLTATNVWLVYTEGPEYKGLVRVPATATTQAFEMAQCSWLTNQQATTALLPADSDPPKTAFVPGWLIEHPLDQTPAITFSTSNDYSNVEFCIRPTSNAVPGKTYKFVTWSTMPGSATEKGAYLRMGKPGDLNDDNVVNTDDLNEVVSNFGRTYP
jgi:hypothetical protein